jgi:hypothetical protein
MIGLEFEIAQEQAESLGPAAALKQLGWPGTVSSGTKES